MAAPIVGYNAIAVLEEKQHLSVPVISRQRPTVAEDYGLSAAPVLVIDLRTIFSCDRAQLIRPVSLVNAMKLL